MLRMKKIIFDVSDEQFDMIMNACRKRKKCIRSLVLRFFFELDYEDEKKRR